MNLKDQKRFWTKVKIGELDECWEWQASIRKTGYGSFKLELKIMDSHRLSWSEINGEIPESLWVLHICDNRKCCNPNHLKLGTPQDNVLDMVIKNRQAKGENNGLSKLIEQQVLAIRKDNKSSRQIAKIYDISHQNVLDIKNRKIWKHI